jgi:creatinase/prolidase-like protein
MCGSESVASRGREARRERLLDLMERRGVGGVVLRRPANFAWYTGGADSRVDRSVRDGVADLLVTAGGEEFVVTTAIEAPRMRLEQTPELPVHERPWTEDAHELLSELSGGAALGLDVPLEHTTNLEHDIAALRRVLDPDAVERLRWIGADAAAAVAEAAGRCSWCRPSAADCSQTSRGWRLHHQGGTTGYGSREIIATPDTHDPIVAGNAFAWNPSITGYKSEETFVLTEGGPEVVTRRASSAASRFASPGTSVAAAMPSTSQPSTIHGKTSNGEAGAG